MELKTLRSFIVLAEELHFRRAAERLHIAQPALSQQIKQLERQLGIELFSRSSRSVALTAAGTAFLTEALRTVAAADRAVETAQSIALGDGPRLAVGFLAQAAAENTSTILADFKLRRPEAVVQLRALTFVDHVSQVRTGGVDVAFIRPPYAPEELAGLTTVPLGTEPRVAILPAGHALAGRRSIAFAEIADEKFVRAPDEVSPVWRAYWRGDDRRGGRPAVLSDETASSVEEMLTVVGAELAISITHASVGRFYARPNVRFVPITDLSFSTLALAWRANDPSPLVQDFIEAARKVMSA